MSLFASSFEAPGAARPAPSAIIGSSSSPAHSHKRKRPSLAGGAERDAQLAQTRVNLDRLMRRVERGDVEERAGREGMGGAGKGGKGGKSGKVGQGGKEGKSGVGGKGEGAGQSGRGAPAAGGRQGRPSAPGRPRDGHANDGKHGKRAEQGKVGRSAEQGKQGKQATHGRRDAPGRTNPRDVAADAAHPPKRAKHTQHAQQAQRAQPPSPAAPAGSASQASPRPAPVELLFDLPSSSKPARAAAGKKTAGAATADDVEAGMTSLQRAMAGKLEGARFRWINEQLYSVPSDEAVSMMRDDPKIFADYHQTHRALTAQWPSPPLPLLAARLAAALPPRALIVDLGCGDAGLARALAPKGLSVLSYDLVGDAVVPGAQGYVVAADFLTHVPLPGRPGGEDAGEAGAAAAEAGRGKGKGKGRGKGAAGVDGPAGAGAEVVDAVVCCLSLMGTNWLGGIYEACRVLKQGGALHVAEVTSRFVEVDAFVDAIESFGFGMRSKDAPSTHFTLFEFTKTAACPVGPVRGQSGWDARVRQGPAILRGCVYKKR